MSFLGVPLREARSVDDLFDTVTDADLVFTHDAPLSQALNRRVTEPQIGRFAMTPRTWATDEFNPRDERHLFHSLVKHTSLDWRDASFALSAILDCWDETGRADAILDYERFDRASVRTALDVITDESSARRALSTTKVPRDQEVAVIGRSSLPVLDRSMLPTDVTAISPFTSSKTALPPFRIHSSQTAIIEALLANIDDHNAHRVGVVMDRGGPFPALVESAFETAGIPYYGGPGFADDPGVRTCLAIARAARETERLRLRDLRGILGECGIAATPSDLEKRVTSMDDPAVDPIVQFITSVEERSFAELLSAVEDWSDRSLDTCRSELELLGLLDRRVTPERVDDFAYYCQTFDVPTKRDDHGVLLADATSASFVDRPVVYHLGLDIDWTRPIPNRPWIDATQRDRRNRDQFDLLLQNGERRLYLVHETEGGSPVIPCLYFQDLIDGRFRQFSDHDHRRYGTVPNGSPRPFPHIPIEAPPDPPRTLSQSDLNSFVNCPLDYCFDQLVESPDRDYFRKGTLFHEYAELAVNHPAFVKQLDREELVSCMLEEMEPFLDRSSRPQLATQFRVGTKIIDRFLRESPPEQRRYKGYRANFWSNDLAERFDRSISSPITEQWFQNMDIGISGVVDLIQRPDRLIDYKSGSTSSVREHVERAGVDPVHEKPNFQSILYLAHHRHVVPNQPVDFVFFHLLEALDDALQDKFTLDDALVPIRYDPRSFAEFAASQDAFDALTSGVAESNARRKTLERFGYDRYEDFFADAELPDVADPIDVLEEPIAAQFETELLAEVGEYKYVKQGAMSALKQLYRNRNERFFPEDLDAFESFVATNYEDLTGYYQSSFPVGEPNEDRLRHRDMIRIDG